MVGTLLSGASSVLGGLGGGGNDAPDYSSSVANAGAGEFKPDTLSGVIPIVIILIIVLIWVKK